MRAAAITMFTVLLFAIVIHILWVIRDALLYRLAEGREITTSLAEDLISPRLVGLSSLVFLLGYYGFAVLFDQDTVVLAASVLIAVIIGWASWVVARWLLRRRVLGDRPVPWVAPAIVALGAAAVFANSGMS